MSVFSGFRLLLRLLTAPKVTNNQTCSAVEKILSDGIKVTGTHNSLRATSAITGNCSWFDLHHNNAHSSWWCSCGYLLNHSSSTFPNLSSCVEHVELVEVPNKNDIAVSFSSFFFLHLALLFVL